jgi:hypothetical protein
MKIKIEIEIDTVDDHEEILDLIEFMKDKFKNTQYTEKKSSLKTPSSEKVHYNAKK